LCSQINSEDPIVRPILFSYTLTLFVTLLLSIPTVAQTTSITDEDLVKGHRGNSETWPMYGGSYDQQRYSELDQIDLTNIQDLEPAWIAHTGLFAAYSGYQTGPVIFDGDMYVTTPRIRFDQWVIKYNAETGEERWRTPIRLTHTRFCCGANNRGATLYGDKVYVATLDARIVALNADTGEELWDISTGEALAGYSQTCAPVAFDGKLFIGTAGGEYGIRGFLKAFDADTGDLLWTWYTIPSPEEGGWLGDWVEEAPGLGISLNRDIEQEKADLGKHPDSWKRGGAPIWTTPSLDPELRLIYVTIGNPGPDFDASARPGDNLWSNSLCAINIDTGKLEWGFQFMPHDLWDYDGGCPPVLFDIEYEGEMRKVAGLFTKVGVFYLVDRVTGELLKASENYVPHDNIFAVPNDEGVTFSPGILGGTNWSPASFNRQTNWVYSVNIHMPTTLKRMDEEFKEGQEWLGGVPSFNLEEDGTTWGNVVAIEPASGKIAWKFKTERPMWGGLITTAGGLVFAGRTKASFDAWNAKTGEHVWQYKLEVGANAPPSTYQINGKQYVVVAAGGGRYLRRSPDIAADAIIAFALPDK
jgi:PQQ-dependent dehydrogenase (methanol/ethanol family)